MSGVYMAQVRAAAMKRRPRPPHGRGARRVDPSSPGGLVEGASGLQSMRPPSERRGTSRPPGTPLAGVCPPATPDQLHEEEVGQPGQPSPLHQAARAGALSQEGRRTLEELQDTIGKLLKGRHSGGRGSRRKARLPQTAPPGGPQQPSTPPAGPSPPREPSEESPSPPPPSSPTERPQPSEFPSPTSTTSSSSGKANLGTQISNHISDFIVSI